MRLRASCCLRGTISAPAGPARSGWGTPAVRAAGRGRIHQNAARTQVAGAVVAQLQYLCGAAAGALEVGIAHRGLLARTMGGTQRWGLRLAGVAFDAAGTGTGTGIGRRFGRRGRQRQATAQDRLRAPATCLFEHRHAHNADVVRAAGAAGIAAAGAAEHELRHFVLALAPAGDVGALAGVEHVAGLRGIGILAGDGVDAVHRQHHQHPARAVVVQAHGVAVAALAGHPALAVGGVAAQFGATVAVDQGHAHRAAFVGRWRRWRRAEAGQGQDQQQGQQAFHRASPAGLGE